MDERSGSNSRLLGLDLGGTNIKVAVVNDSGPASPGAVIHSGQIPTNAEEGPEAVADRMADIAVEAISLHGPITTVGVGVPGLFDIQSGRIQFFTNLPGSWEGFPLRSHISDRTGLPTTLINDARAFTLAEGSLGAGRRGATVACITLGTGVGGGLMVGGSLHVGGFGTAGELGHQTVDPDGPVCGCGNPGCLEALARPPAVAAEAGKDTFEEVLDGYRDSDADCVRALDRAVEAFGVGLANVMTMFGPDVIVIGGGAAQGDSLLIDLISRAVRDRVTLVPPEHVQIVPASLGSGAGAIGAALAPKRGGYGSSGYQAGDLPSVNRRRDEIAQ